MSEHANVGVENHQSQSQTYLGKEYNENLIDKGILLCDALNCDREATEKIEFSAGIYGTLLINVCKNCVGIFKGVGGNTNDFC